MRQALPRRGFLASALAVPLVLLGIKTTRLQIGTWDAATDSWIDLREGDICTFAGSPVAFTLTQPKYIAFGYHDWPKR